MKYAFIKTNPSSLPLQDYCKLFHVSRSGYYAWLKRKPSQRELSNRRIDTKIKHLFTEHKAAYRLAPNDAGLKG